MPQTAAVTVSHKDLIHAGSGGIPLVKINNSRFAADDSAPNIGGVWGDDDDDLDDLSDDDDN